MAVTVPPFPAAVRTYVIEPGLPFSGGTQTLRLPDVGGKEIGVVEGPLIFTESA